MSRLLLSCQPGIYLVDFNDDTVKVGRSHNLRERLRRHVKAGAVRVSAWAIDYDTAWPYMDHGGTLGSVEFGALRTISREGQQIRATERVRAIPFTRASELVDQFLRRRWHGAIAAHLGMTVDELLKADPQGAAS